jgi:hypothetical protein
MSDPLQLRPMRGEVPGVGFWALRIPGPLP